MEYDYAEALRSIGSFLMNCSALGNSDLSRGLSERIIIVYGLIISMIITDIFAILAPSIYEECSLPC